MEPGRHGVVAMIGIDFALEPLQTVRRQALGELAQRAEAAGVPVPNILLAAVVGVADSVLKRQIEGVAEQFLHERRVAPSQR